MSEHSAAWPCALTGLPPPRPPHTARVARTQSSALKPSAATASGTTANAMSLPPLPTSSSLRPRNAMSGAIFFAAFITFWDAFESAAMSTFKTRTFLLSATASSICSLTTFRILSTLAASALFLASTAFFWTPSILTRSSALTTAEVKASSSSLRRPPACLSRSGVSKLSSSRAPTLAAYFSPSSMASFAAALVTALILRIPLATAVSSTRANASASAVLETWVPPQNSIEVSPPTDTTRTGSG
mmetsp:Transcript_9220/g.25922  ORF Transcript_9220/g.25922 Transcript_9220/m.25922 type:complete len:244 (-) Transcript_9220:1727-2458(-)